MDTHVCKQCGALFMYCRKCTFRPIRYKDAGFCSKACYEASKAQPAPTVEPVVEPTPIVEPIVEPSIEPEVEPIIEEVAPIEEVVPTETEVEVETPTIEVVAVEEPTIKKETNTYKKKRNKYDIVHE